MKKRAEAESGRGPRRIVITVGADSHLASTLELAAALAVAEKAALHGLFIEDEDLLNVASLPFTQEVMRSCGQPRTLDDRQLARSLLRAGSAFRKSLARHADSKSLHWSYSSVRGRRYALELGEAEHADILVIAHPQAGRSQPRYGPLRILFCPDHSVLALPAIKAILGHNPGRDIELLVLDDGDAADGSSETELAQLMGDYPRLKVLPCPETSVADLLGSRSGIPDCIVASRNLARDQVRKLVDLASCPLIIVS